ncbi:MAG: DUF615 domain-containing protein [Pseudomonadales bacterium]|nr:DUF615 domain-containing protein [Pseudomonadales bacterium]MCP5215887.1 DUF615 domain-containing protein [Pseudomonadales bacterium]
MIQEPNSPELESDEKSKSQIKREMEALQEMGKRLTELNNEQLSQVPVEENVFLAIKEYQRLTKHEAKRRQLQYLGRLMRNADAEAIAQVLNLFDSSHATHTQHFHQIETWRERLLNDPNSITAFIDEYPQVNVQHLRQLIRNTLKERDKGKDLGGYRKLFRELRELMTP